MMQTSTGDRLADFDFSRHNAEQKQAWEAHNAGRPYRAPIVVGTNSRYFLFNAAANREGLTFRQYTEDADAMFEAQLRFARWSRFNILQDRELGPLTAGDFWTVSPDFQNYYEAAWFGCPIEYLSDQVPDTTPIFADCPERLMERGLPDPFAGNNRRALDYWEHFQQRAAAEDFLGRPIRVARPRPA